MDFLPPLTVLERSQVSPPPATIGCKSLPLTFFDIHWFAVPDPVHTLFFYEHPITKTHFTETTVPMLKQSLSITLQYFSPFAGKLTIFPADATKIPEIRYVEGDSVDVTIGECNLDFNDLTGNHPRECDKFYHLIPLLLGPTAKVSDHVTMPVFAVQVTLFPNYGISIGLTYHHSLGDASTTSCFRKAWASITRSHEFFLANGTLPIYERLIKNPKLDVAYIKNTKVDTINEDYKLSRLSVPTDHKVRATFILTRTMINDLKKLVATELPTLAYVSSFTVTCAYILNCEAELNKDELVAFIVNIDCRSRLDPPIPAAYFGNCIMPCAISTRTHVLKGKEGFLRAAKLIGENLYEIMSDKDMLVRDVGPIEDWFPDGCPTKIIWVAGTPKLKFYDLDFGFGNPIKYETVSIDYSGTISISSSRESNEDMEIGVSMSANDMDAFVGNFNTGLESYI